MTEPKGDTKPVAQLQDEETLFYQEAFDMFDWNHSGTIPTSVRQGEGGGKEECLNRDSSIRRRSRREL